MIVIASNPNAFVVWFEELERWDVDFFRQVEWHWSSEIIRPIGEILERKRLEIDPKIDRRELPIIEKITFGGQISVTNEKTRTGYKGRLFWANAGDLVYSKIRVKQGSLAVIPPEIENLAVSAEYPVYNINPCRVDGTYLELVLRSSAFLRLLEGLSHGGSTKTRIPPEVFEKQSIPLPSLSVQRSIVATWEQARAEVAELHQRLAALEAQIERDFLADLGLAMPERVELPKAFALWWEELERWSVMFNQLALVGTNITIGSYPSTMLGEVAKVSYGIQKSPANRPGDHARPYLRVANVQRGELDLSKIKYINVPDAEMESYRLEPGDLLFVEGNGSRAELGRCAIWHGEIEDCVHQNHLLKVRLDHSRVLADYAMTWFNTELGKDHFFRNVKTSSGLGTINSSELRKAPLPLPPLSVQQEMVRRVAAHRAEIAALKTEAEQKAAQSKADVEAMILGAKAVPIQG